MAGLRAMFGRDRSRWSGDVQTLGEGFRLQRFRCDRQLEAVCQLRTHPLGWGLVLSVNESPQRSEVCTSHDEMLDKCESWRSAMVERGWS
jgi:hypothetical protein